MPLPDFLCVGAQKSGTSTLYYIFKQHPQVLVPTYKQIHYFDYPHNYEKGSEWYQQHFDHFKDEKRVGAVSPDCMHLKESPKRIKKTLGADVKLIFLLRNPVDRAFSHYLMTYRLGYEKEPFLKAIQLEKERIEQNIEYKHRFSYISRGKYYKHIKHYLNYFPINQMKFLIFEELYNAKKGRDILEELFEFLDINSIDVDLGVKKNKGAVPVAKWLTPFISKRYKDKYPVLRWLRKTLVPTQRLRNFLLRYLKRERPRLEADTKHQLYKQYFKKDIEQLEQLIEKDLKVWRPSHS